MIAWLSFVASAYLELFEPTVSERNAELLLFPVQHIKAWHDPRRESGAIKWPTMLGPVEHVAISSLSVKVEPVPLRNDCSKRAGRHEWRVCVGLTTASNFHPRCKIHRVVEGEFDGLRVRMH